MLLKQGQADQLIYYIYYTREAAGQAAAKDIAEAMHTLLAEKETINMIFAAAPSQNEVLAALVANRDIPWNRVNAFHMDEYIGLSEDAPQRFGNFLKEAIFDKVPLRSVHYIDCSATDIQAECLRYTDLLQSYPVDIVCLGIGENGHIAFNDPGVADFDDQALVKVAELDQICRRQQVNDGCFSSIDEVPTHALTLTIPALCHASAMFCTVPAQTKRWAVTQTVRGAITAQCPASVLRNHNHARLYCDRFSAEDLLKK